MGTEKLTKVVFRDGILMGTFKDGDSERIDNINYADLDGVQVVDRDGNVVPDRVVRLSRGMKERG